MIKYVTVGSNTKVVHCRRGIYLHHTPNGSRCRRSRASNMISTLNLHPSSRSASNFEICYYRTASLSAICRRPRSSPICSCARDAIDQDGGPNHGSWVAKCGTLVKASPRDRPIALFLASTYNFTFTLSRAHHCISPRHLSPDFHTMQWIDS